MLELPRLDINYPSEIIEQALLSSHNDRVEAFGNATLAQICISCKYVEMDTFLDELVDTFSDEHPGLIKVFNMLIPTSIRSWTFYDGSILVLKHGKFTLWQM